MLKLLLITLSCLFIAHPTLAAQKPGFLDGIISADKPAGTATLRKFFIKAYDAQLWVDGNWSYEKPFALKLIYDVSIDSEEFVESTFDQIQATSRIRRSKLAVYTKDLETAFPDVVAGDSITAVYRPATSVTFYFNGTKRHTMTDMRFAKYFFDIWLSKETTEPSLRNELLAGLRE